MSYDKTEYDYNHSVSQYRIYILTLDTTVNLMIFGSLI